MTDCMAEVGITLVDMDAAVLEDAGISRPWLPCPDITTSMPEGQIHT